MKRIGIIVALTSEYELVKNLLSDTKEKQRNNLRFVEGTVNGMEVTLMKSGMGKVCAAMGAVEIAREYAPDAIVNTGVAGGIDPLTHVMDIVVGENTVYHDVWCGDGNAYGQVLGFPLYFPANKRLYDTALSVPHEGHVYGGLICTGDQFVSDKERLKEIKHHFPTGLAVDMESCAIAQVCHQYGIPFLSYRIISDTPGSGDNFAQYLNFWEEAPRRSFEMLHALLAKFAEL